MTLRSPEGFAPDIQIIEGDTRNEDSYNLQNFGDGPTEVDLAVRLSLDSPEEPITSETTVDLEGGETKEITSTFHVPAVHCGDVRFEYSIDSDLRISTPIQFLSELETEWLYEAENTNHRAGQEVSDPAALNGTAWEAVAGEDDGGLDQNHVV